MHRRKFLGLSLVGASMLLARPGRSAAAPTSRFKAIAFDGFPLLDPRPIYGLVETLFPGRGAEISASWKSRQFEYTWLRASGAQYRDFWQVTEDALVYATRVAGVALAPEQRQQLMNAWLKLKAWPEVPAVLQQFRDAGLSCAFLSNFSPSMLAAATASAGLGGLVTRAISTDSARTYKPDPRAYQLGVDQLGLSREEILFVPFAPWDATGAKWFGYPVFWVNRQQLPAEELGVAPDGEGRDLLDLERFVFST
jgi:2-haloacid dehalogenase